MLRAACFHAALQSAFERPGVVTQAACSDVVSSAAAQCGGAAGLRWELSGRCAEGRGWGERGTAAANNAHAGAPVGCLVRVGQPVQLASPDEEAGCGARDHNSR